jgi:hypothetical protein
MRKELENIENIEHYLEGKLDNSDHNKFEQDMLEDPVFKETVDLQRQITGHLKEEAFLADVASYHQDFVAQEKRGRKQGIWFITPVLLLSTVLIIWWAMQPPADTIGLSNASIEEPTNTVGNTIVNQEENVLEITTKAFQINFITKKINAKKGAVIDLKGSESVLHIPAFAVVDKEGNTVKGTYLLQYRELKDRAQFAFSGISMMYENSEGNHTFNSAGIFEVQAFKDGVELQLASDKKLILDYEINEPMSGLGFYYLDGASQTWLATKEHVELPQKGAKIEKFDRVGYQSAQVKHEKKFDNYIKAKKEAIRNGKEWNLDGTTLWPDNIEEVMEEERPNPNKYIVVRRANPKLVQGLNIASLGAYNCSQIYKIENQVAISGTYTDLKRVEIEGAQVLSVIDLDYNAAYSFVSEDFLCNSKANNVFLLLTKEDKLYAFVKSATQTMTTGTYSFAMEDLSKSIQSTSDLRDYLKFVAQKTVTNIN